MRQEFWENAWQTRVGRNRYVLFEGGIGGRGVGSLAALHIEIQGYEQLLRRLDGLVTKLSDLPWTRVRDEIWGEIRAVFATSAQGRSFRWPGWRPWTEDWRTNRGGYYSRPGPVEDKIGVWSDELRTALTSDTSPGYTKITKKRLEMGIREGRADPKYTVFITGRPAREGVKKWFKDRFGQFHRNWAGWMRGGSGQVYKQEPRPVYENLNLDREDESNPVVRVISRWMREEVGLGET